MKSKHTIIVLLLGAALLQACSKLEPAAPDADSVMDAPLDGLTQNQYRLFNAGADEFDQIYTSADGLGPIYVATSCGSCHTADNRGHLFTMLTRYGQTDTTGNPYADKGGPQIQNHAIPGYTPEKLPAGVASSGMIAPIVSGTGFLELVPDADIIAMAAANEDDIDGVRGRPHWNELAPYVKPANGAISKGGRYITRFGRKANNYNLHQQCVVAFNEDMGVTSTFLPQEPVNYLAGMNSVPTSDPEVTDQSVNALVFYIQTLQAPLQRNANDAAVLRGASTFSTIGCETCHKSTLKTGYSAVAPLSYQVFHPYTDLLLHDMGPRLDDGYTEGYALSSEWRTTPLWGLGLARDAQGGGMRLLHDGRATSIEEAILYHGGEAQKSRDRYEQLSAEEQNDLLAFLNSL